ncbi:hypothetical protein JW977_02085 [Candidatus Falkowbacteria bacterium]|nr:hypothetical protein [Candidatus Falkowbacteria bacterium]
MSIIISQNGKNAKRIDPASFGKENYLQQYIYENPESIPLYEIKEDIRLLILKREFPTSSGPIDALGIDKDGEIYLVETKLYKNPDKRLVVAQVLDYGASLWSTSLDFNEFISIIEDGVSKNFKTNLNAKLKQFFNLDDDGINQLLDSVQKNLNEGKLKFVVLMDKLHDRLKDLILYINENSKFDIFAVELEYYKHDNFEILIPKLFGAEVKKDIGVASKSGQRKKWDESSFFDDLKNNVSPKQVEAIKKLYQFSKDNADDIRWGTGVTSGSFNPIFNKISNKSVYTVKTNGHLILNFHWLNDLAQTASYRDKLKKGIESSTDLKIANDYQDKFFEYDVETWSKDIDNIIKVIKSILK